MTLIIDNTDTDKDYFYHITKVKKYANELKIKKVWKQVRNQISMETS